MRRVLRVGEVLDRFVAENRPADDHARSKESGPGNWSQYSSSGSSISFEGDTLWSYRMLLAVRKDAGFGHGIRYIVNGDESTPTTNGHQRSAISKCRPGVQIPFSALEEAVKWLSGGSHPAMSGYILDNLTIVDHEEDKFVPEVCHRSDCFREHVPLGANEEHIERATFQRTRRGGWHAVVDGQTYTRWAGGEIRRIVYEKPGEHTHQVHRLGATLVRLRATRYSNGDVAEEREDTFLSAWDTGNGDFTYFLCQVPGFPQTIAQAYLKLKPEIVRSAEETGHIVKRQGDIFAIKTDLTPRNVPGLMWHRSHRVLETRHYVTWTAKSHDDLYGYGMMWHETTGRRRSWGRGGPDHKRISLPLGVRGEKGAWLLVKNTSAVGFSAIGYVD